jgi:hypothetical protein
VAPNGGKYWRYNYRFDGKQKTLALGIYPSDAHHAHEYHLVKGRNSVGATCQSLTQGT